MYLHTYTYTHIRTHTRTHTHTYTYTHTLTHIHARTRTHTHTHACTHTHTQKSMVHQLHLSRLSYHFKCVYLFIYCYYFTAVTGVYPPVCCCQPVFSPGLIVCLSLVFVTVFYCYWGCARPRLLLLAGVLAWANCGFMLEMFNSCVNCRAPLEPEDGHRECPSCLGVEHLRQGLTELACADCMCLSMAARTARLAMVGPLPDAPLVSGGRRRGLRQRGPE